MPEVGGKPAVPRGRDSLENVSSGDTVARYRAAGPGRAPSDDDCLESAACVVASNCTCVYAPRFALGWGPAIVRWRAKGAETEYVIAALPIGGYVRMASKEDEAAALLEDRKSTRLNSSNTDISRMPSSA